MDDWRGAPRDDWRGAPRDDWLDGYIQQVTGRLGQAQGPWHGRVSECPWHESQSVRVGLSMSVLGSVCPSMHVSGSVCPSMHVSGSRNHERVRYGSKDIRISVLTALKIFKKCSKMVFSESG